MYVIKAKRSNRENISVCKKSRMCVLSKKKKKIRFMKKKSLERDFMCGQDWLRLK